MQQSSVREARGAAVHAGSSGPEGRGPEGRGLGGRGRAVHVRRGRAVRTRPVRRPRPSGPRPVRPGALALVGRPSVRPVGPARPPGPPRRGAPRPGERVLLRRPAVPVRIARRRRVAAGLGVVVLGVLAVLLLGLLADVAAAARAGSVTPPSPAAVVSWSVSGLPVLGG